MIRSENARVSFLDANGQTLKLVNLYGSSEDTKPTGGLASGSTFVEVDTGKLFLFNEAASTWLEIGSGSGGNPNSVQVITGTLANPFGDVDLEELETAFDNGGASMTIIVDATVIGQGVFPRAVMNWTSEYSFTLSSVRGYTTELVSAALVIWDSDTGNVSVATMYSGATGTDILSYAASIPTTLTIYWHPMPEGE